MTNQIQLWLDKTSDNGPRYCVSLCEPDGSEIRLLSSYAVEDHCEAWEVAKDEAQRAALTAVEIDAHDSVVRSIDYSDEIDAD